MVGAEHAVLAKGDVRDAFTAQGGSHSMDRPINLSGALRRCIGRLHWSGALKRRNGPVHQRPVIGRCLSASKRAKYLQCCLPCRLSALRPSI